ncbi:hypothetical protein ACQQ2Q_10175 [Agrobacterium sp. ES01]|uniref:hypothetical protein n=1 Tax=Agrobacterium sp. ES01 TaxID=3420714 RepID=UPI003D11BD19
MNAITRNLPKDIGDKIEAIALQRGVLRKALLENLAKELVEHQDAVKLDEEMAERSRGRIDEALELLQR